MDIKFKVKADALRVALDIVSLVEAPQISKEDGGSGYLFVVKRKVEAGADDGKPFCLVYSRDDHHAARVEVQITDLEGEGDFVYPAQFREEFKYAEDREISFHAKSEGKEFTLKYMFEGGLGGTERGTYNPQLISPCDKMVEDALASTSQEYPTAVLREALSMSGGFLNPDSNSVKDEHKIIYIHDAAEKADGTMHTTDGWQIFYFECNAFKGQSLQIHSRHVGDIKKFLAKCGPTVKIATGSNMTFAVSKDNTVFGWSKHDKASNPYKLFQPAWDKIRLLVPKVPMVHWLEYVCKAAGKDTTKIRVDFGGASGGSEGEPGPMELRLSTVNSKTSSPPIKVSFDLAATGAPDSEQRKWKFFADPAQLLLLFRDTKALDVRLQLCPIEQAGQKPHAGFKTIDEFSLDAAGNTVGGPGATMPNSFACKVIRFTPGKT
jgi:hypothetical protein